MTPKGRIKSGCLRHLERRCFFAWNNPFGTMRIAPDRWHHFGKKGSADILGILPGGRFLAVEYKAQHGRLSNEQQQFLETVRGLGGVTVIARSFGELDTELRREGYADDGPFFDGIEYGENAPEVRDENHKRRRR